MSTLVVQADACQICPPPFDRDSCPALSVQATPGGTLTGHRCDRCGSSWLLWSDVWGWPVERKLDPMSPEQAEANLLALALALEGTKGAPRRAA